MAKDMTKDEYLATLGLTSELKAAYSQYLEDQYKDYLYMKHKYDAELSGLRREFSQIQMNARKANNKRRMTAEISGRNSPEELSNSENATEVREILPEKRKQIEESLAEYAELVKDDINRVKDYIQRSENAARAIASRKKGGKRFTRHTSKGAKRLSRKISKLHKDKKVRK